MTDTQIVHLGLEAMTIAAKLCAPVLLTALTIGFAISLFQSVTQIQEAVCEQYGLALDDLLGKSRIAKISGPRQLAMYLTRMHTKASLPAIGQAFGGRNHTTVLHAIKKVESQIGKDPDVDDAVRAVTARLGADRRD